MMVGRVITNILSLTGCAIGRTIPKVRDLTLPRAFQHVSFILRRSRIPGAAGWGEACR